MRRTKWRPCAALTTKLSHRSRVSPTVQRAPPRPKPNQAGLITQKIYFVLASRHPLLDCPVSQGVAFEKGVCSLRECELPACIVVVPGSVLTQPVGRQSL